MFITYTYITFVFTNSITGNSFYLVIISSAKIFLLQLVLSLSVHIRQYLSIEVVNFSVTVS